jgi:hypothetical protein
MTGKCNCSPEPSRLEPWKHDESCPFHDEAVIVCPLCWAEFATEDDLAQHEQEEQATSYQIKC